MQMKMKKPWKSYGGATSITDADLTTGWAAFKNALSSSSKTISKPEWSASDAGALIVAARVTTPSAAADKLTSTEIAAVNYDGTNNFTKPEIEVALDAAIAAAAPITTVLAPEAAGVALAAPISVNTFEVSFTIYSGGAKEEYKAKPLDTILEGRGARGGMFGKVEVNFSTIQTEAIAAVTKAQIIKTSAITQDFVNKLAGTLYKTKVLERLNKSLQDKKIDRTKTSTLPPDALKFTITKTVPPPPGTVTVTHDQTLSKEIEDALRAAYLVLQATTLQELTTALQTITEKQTGGRSKKDDKKQRRFKGGFQEVDMGKMYDAQGLISDLSASHDQNIITNPNVYPNPFSAGGLSQSSEGIDANLSDSIKFDVVPSYNGGSKQKKASRRK